MFRKLVLSTVTLAALAAPLMTASNASAGGYGTSYAETGYHENVNHYYGHKKKYYRNCYKKPYGVGTLTTPTRSSSAYKTICN